jgi:hypothetical protein
VFSPRLPPSAFGRIAGSSWPVFGLNIRDREVSFS